MTLQVFEWRSYAANNSSDHRLIATFESVAAADAMAKELTTLFALHSKQVEEADEDDDADWDPWDLDVSPALQEFAAKYNSEFAEGIMWGDEGCSSEDLPEVTTLGNKIYLYHGYMSGGFGGGLDGIIGKAGATDVVIEDGPQWLQFTVTATKGKAGELFEAIQSLLQQREELDNLCDFEVPWGTGLPIEQTVDNVVMVATDDGAIFTLAMGADAIADCRKWLAANHAIEIDVELVGDAEIEALHAREIGVGGAADGAAGLFDPSGKSFLFTGKLSSMTRTEAQARVSTLGGLIAKSVNKSLDVLVIGDEGSPLFGGGAKGSKQIKAETLIAGGQALQIISETDFIKLGGVGDVGVGEESAKSTESASVDIEIPRTAPMLSMVRSREQAEEQDTNFFKGMTSSGDSLYATGTQTILRSKTGSSWEAIRHVQDHSVWKDHRWVSGEIGYHGILAGEGELLVAGTGFVLSSTDDSTFRHYEIEPDVRLQTIGRDNDGVWAAGDSVWLCRDGENFERVKVAGKAPFNKALRTPLGMLLCRNNGNVFFGINGKLKKSPLRAKSPLYDACVTKTGAIVVVGHGDWDGAAFRTTDGIDFQAASLPIKKQIHGIACLDDGRLITGGSDDTLLVSYDDGRSFEVLEHDFKGTSNGRDGNTAQYPRSFSKILRHAGAIVATCSFQATLRIE